MQFESAVHSLDALEVQYDVARTLRQLLTRRLGAFTIVVFALVVWFHVIPWIAFVVTFLLATGLVGMAVRNEYYARRRCRTAAAELARLTKVLPQNGIRPRVQ